MIKDRCGLISTYKLFNVRFVVEQRNKKKCKKPRVIHTLGNIKC